MSDKPILLIVGESPAKTDPSGVLTERSQSGRRLEEWLDILDPDHNYDYVKINAKPGLERGEAWFSKDLELKLFRDMATACITLGSYAANAMAEITYDYWILPHPSGLNRQLNDTIYLNNKLEGVKQLLKERYEERHGSSAA